jgi:hypothetical protein
MSAARTCSKHFAPQLKKIRALNVPLYVLQMIKLRRQFEDLLGESGLLHQERGDAALTSSERMARHGEIRQLKEARRNHAKEVSMGAVPFSSSFKFFLSRLPP